MSTSQINISPANSISNERTSKTSRNSTKKFILGFCTFLLLFCSPGWITLRIVFGQHVSVGFQIFYEQLSPFGIWVNYPRYGYVWIPNVDRDFTPYATEGHWVYTEDGWTWVSDYSWGWAPFHYGRWDYDDSYGWFWVPHHRWGPAWVVWRRCDGYYGWSPMRPGVSIAVSFGSRYHESREHWIFARDRDINRRDIDRHYINRADNINLLRNSRVINRTHEDRNRHVRYIAGPDRNEVQRVSGAAIRPVSVQNINEPGQSLSNDRLRIYRPQVQTSTNNDPHIAPAHVMNLKDVKPLTQRSPGGQSWSANPLNRISGNMRPSEPRNPNPTENNKKIIPPNPTLPSNRNNDKMQPIKPSPAAPPNINRKEIPPASSNPRLERDMRVRPVEPRVVTPPINNRKEISPTFSIPRVDHYKKLQPVEPRTITPSVNSRKEIPPNPSLQNYNKGNMRQIQPRTFNPPNNGGNMRQQNGFVPRSNNQAPGPRIEKRNADPPVNNKQRK